MESHEVLRLSLEKANPKQVASVMGCSVSLVYKWAQSADDGSGTINPLDRVLQLFQITKDDMLIHWLCRKSGGFFVRNPKVDKEEFDLMPATQTIVQQFAEMLTAISKAAADHTITDDEAAIIREEWDDLQRFTEGFVRCCENGDFSGMERLQTEMGRKKKEA
jgi:transcriptional regulator with XRE-family HTH domain